MSEKKAVTVELDPKAKGKCKRLGGSDFDDWNNRLLALVAGALPVGQTDRAALVEAATATSYGMMEINPADPIEGILAGQLVVANEAALSLYQRAWAQSGEYFEARAKYLALADKAARTVALLIERLDQHRGRGQQQILVKHVTVNAEQAMVADSIIAATPAGRPVPVPALPVGGAERPMPIVGERFNRDPVTVGTVGVGAKAK